MLNLIKRNRKSNERNASSDFVEYGFDFPALFDDFISKDFFGSGFESKGVSTPAVNIIENADEFHLEMVAPGMKKNDFKIEVENDVLTVSYDHEDNRKGERLNSNYKMREYNYHSFSRSFSLPDIVDAEKIKAKYEDGILNLFIPKKEEAKTKPLRKITIS